MRRAWRALLGILLGSGLPLACLQGHRCQSDAQCSDGELEGVCTAGGHCAFPSEDCPSGLVYGELVEPGLAGECVPVSDGTSTTGTSDGPSSSGGGSTPTGDDTTGSSACPPGASCQPEDPCAAVGICNDVGSCIPTESITCDEPPGPCHAALGECQPGGGCTYPVLPAGTPCDDDDPCTTDTTCDDAGTCAGGDPCVADDPCQVARCALEGCVQQPVDDGTPCGMLESQRCCGGACVDISSDAAHCGGCNSPCAEGQPCEPISETPLCGQSEPNTSGRCRCSGNAQCPLGQLCRNQFPYPNRCAPQDDGDCDGIAVVVGSCPDYCSY